MTVARFSGMSALENAYQPAYVGTASGTAAHLQWTTHENGATVIYRHEPAPSVWRRIVVNVLSWLPVRREL